ADDAAAMKKGIEALNGAMHAITMRMYREGGQQHAKEQAAQRSSEEAARAAYEGAGKGGGQEGSQGGPGPGDTVDVEYEDVSE
ncbi:MAG: hypothetical protein L0Z54_06940, partial [Thermoplasmata archaeon]|nr:hypothetical protein [Thermoplasmata archaeon]